MIVVSSTHNHHEQADAMNSQSNSTPTVDLYFDRRRRRVGFVSAFASAVVAMSAAVDIAGAATPSRPRR